MKNITSGMPSYWNNTITIRTIDKGNLVFIDLLFQPYLAQWIMNVRCEAENFEAAGIRVTNSTNLLYNFKNNIDFGIMCISEEKDDPIFIDDFSNGRYNLYLLNQEEVNNAFNGVYNELIIDEVEE
jgi:hypothetical protein